MPNYVKNHGPIENEVEMRKVFLPNSIGVKNYCLIVGFNANSLLVIFHVSNGLSNYQGFLDSSKRG